MNKKRYRCVEFPKIKRNLNSWEGKVIEYLLEHPSGKPASESSMEANTAYWVVETLLGKVSQEEFSYACRFAIEKLEGKLATIIHIAVHIAGLSIEKVPASHTTSLAAAPITVTPTISDNENKSENHIAFDDESDEEGENSFMDFAPTKEMEVADKIFGTEI